MVRKFVLLCLCILLSACQSSTETSLQQSKKRMAAKINDQLGIAYLERHDIQRSKQKFLLALKQAPEIPETWYSMGYFLESTDNKEQANHYYLKAIELAPGRGDALNNYGTFLCRSGKYHEAISYFMKAAEDPNYLEQASAYENAGLCSLKIPDNKNAIAYFKRSLEQDPNRPNSLIELSELNYKNGHYQLAKHELTKYLQVMPPSVQTYVLAKKLDNKLLA